MARLRTHLPSIGQRGISFMVRLDQVIYFQILQEWLDLAGRNARAASLDLPSTIICGGNGPGRNFENQLNGQLGEMALSLYLTGDIAEYAARRERINRTPYQGDGGRDSDRYRIDVKCCRQQVYHMRLPIQYSLVVREKDRHAGHVYVLVVAIPPGVTSELWRVGLVGWVDEPELPKEPSTLFAPNKKGPCYTIEGRLMHPLMPLRLVQQNARPVAGLGMSGLYLVGGAGPADDDGEVGDGF